MSGLRSRIFAARTGVGPALFSTVLDCEYLSSPIALLSNSRSSAIVPTHQVRVILISCVVITSLFYPALDLYTSSHTSSQSILDAIISPATNSVENDLVSIWAAQDTLRIHEDAVTRAKCRDGKVAARRAHIHPEPLVEEDGTLNHQSFNRHTTSSSGCKAVVA